MKHLINWNKEDNVWNEFSKLNNIDLKYKERTLNNVIQTNYLINYTNEIATFSFIGMVSKSAEGNNTDKTSIIVEYKNRLNIENFEIKNASNTKDLPSNDNSTDIKKRILKMLQPFKGNSFTLRDNFIRIDTDRIFSTIDEFEHVTDLIVKLKQGVKQPN